MTALALIALQLGACATSGSGVPLPKSQLPPVPADIQQCLRTSGVAIPDRDLTAGEVEGLWKKDRVKIVVLRTCGNRFMTWYEGLRQTWK